MQRVQNTSLIQLTAEISEHIAGEHIEHIQFQLLFFKT